ncbi:MAG TPA: hypothetical protein VNK04_22955 [Gemmataceae bacterium]|nr:hypothetical protein [Gemmataceae bacterium]
MLADSSDDRPIKKKAGCVPRGRPRDDDEAPMETAALVIFVDIRGFTAWAEAARPLQGSPVARGCDNRAGA